MNSDLSSKKRRLRTLVLIIVAAIVFIWGVGSAVGYYLFRESVADAVNANRLIAKHFSELILEHQTGALGIIKSYAHRPLLIDAVKRRNLQAVVQHLKELDDISREIDMVFISDKDGILWANHPVDKESHGKNLSNTDWYKAVRKEWKPYVSEVYQKIVAEKDLAVTACTPIFDKKGDVIGILGTSQRTLFLADLARRVKLNAGTKITLIDQAGRVIFGDKFPDQKEVIPYQPFAYLKEAFRKGQTDTSIEDPYEGGRIKYFSFIPIEELGWSVVVERGRAEILRSQFINFALVGAVSLLLCVGVIWGSMYITNRYNHSVEVHFLSSRILTAQEEERKRIAGDIHDGLGSQLGQIRFIVEGVLEKVSGRGGPEVMKPLKSIIPIIQEVVDECRRIQMDLRPPMLDDLGILATLPWFCRRFQTIYPGIRIEQKININEGEVPDSLKTIIFRISQEAMNNAAKHGKPNLISLCLSGEGKTIELAIRDNGTGFNVEEMLSKERSRRGLGLESMRERVELSGGTFIIESTRDKGTVIRASWSAESESR